MKFHGKIGFINPDSYTEKKPGVYKPEVIEKSYFGEVLRHNRRNQDSGHQNDNVTLSNQISILSDMYLQENWGMIAYILWNNVRWKVSRIEVNYPRIILDLGEVYNGEKPSGAT